jgi:hypothetical protein
MMKFVAVAAPRTSGREVAIDASLPADQLCTLQNCLQPYL